MKNKSVTINGKRGEYTGWSGTTCTHNFSMYDGSVIRLSELETITEFGIDFVNHEKNLGDQLLQITKANGFDILAQRIKELEEENNLSRCM